MDTGLDVRAFNACTAAAAVSVAVVPDAVPDAVPDEGVDSPGWIVEFGAGAVLDGPADPERLGGKGAGLAAMARLGVPVPPGFILTTGAGQRVRADGHRLPPALERRIEAALAALEARSGARFGGRDAPLLLAVRSGAKVSMPGMMDTVLNLGLNDATVEGLAERHGDARFAYDCYRRLIQTYAPVVLGVPAHAFDDLLDGHKRARGLVRDADLTAEDWQILLPRYRQAVQEACGRPFPQDPREQLREAIGAVFRSWNNPRAVAYRALHGLPDQGGTAVTVQAMAFGNRDERSGSGVLFTRDPSTGEPGLCGEFLANAQGEDVVSGVRDPDPLTERQSAERGRAVGGLPSGSMERRMLDVFAALLSVAGRLERAFGDMQDIEFTVESGRLFILQTRAGKRSSAASVRIAVDLAEEGIITREEAVRRVDPRALDELLRPTLAPGAEAEALAIGLPASPGAVTGRLAFTGDEAVRLAAGGVAVILCRPETAPDDILGMQAAAGILTARGGFTSHAATVARGLGRPCVAGARTLRIDVERGVLTVGAVTLRGGDLMTIDGSSGAVLAGAAPLTRTEPDGAVARLLEWTRNAARNAA
ncbi:pyruvate, phosphate dikinase [Azospirillum doebereinerae]|uniref:Pyruvate, phosphate dikinase n=1 Tax=Azospirillum doebereinerae TaxID=92933 RepID=A0A433J0W2_9PROT|nr:pyruvate, phosphate dikinase [Azospirillum doebereinerae]MCG5243954.1 pyruvate, phosphate dikinase [Azospirillum doebereinerae]RUQ63296.1 pyruvate, phosphate dikinase [Azospirillum doebereinerae]